MFVLFKHMCSSPAHTCWLISVKFADNGFVIVDTQLPVSIASCQFLITSHLLHFGLSTHHWSRIPYQHQKTPRHICVLWHQLLISHFGWIQSFPIPKESLCRSIHGGFSFCFPGKTREAEAHNYRAHARQTQGRNTNGKKTAADYCQRGAVYLAPDVQSQLQRLYVERWLHMGLSLEACLAPGLRLEKAQGNWLWQCGVCKYPTILLSARQILRLLYRLSGDVLAFDILPDIRWHYYARWHHRDLLGGSTWSWGLWHDRSMPECIAL